MNEEAAALLPAAINPYKGYLGIHYSQGADLTDFITDTRYLDSGSGGAQSAAVSAAANYYYAVVSVDADGDESAQSLAVSTPSVGAGSNSEGGGGGCFISTTTPVGFNSSFKILMVIVSVIIGFLMVEAIVKPQRGVRCG